MIHDAVRALFQAIAAVLVGLLIAVPILIWRLSSGPIVLDFLSPYIEEALTARDRNLIVRLESTVLSLGEGDRILEIHARNVRAHAGGSDQPIASVPDMALSLDGHALLRGVISPHSIRLDGVAIRLLRDEGGRIEWGLGGGGAAEGASVPASAPYSADAGAVVAAIRDALLGAPDPARPGRALQSFSIRNADITIDDRALGTAWRVSKAALRLGRDAGGITVSGTLPLDLAGERGEVAVEAAYRKGDGSAEATLRLGGIRPAVLARFGGPLAERLDVIDMPLAGTIGLRLDGNGRVERLGFDLSGGAGTLNLPAPFASRRAVASAAVRGEVTADMTRLDLHEARIDLGGPVATLSAVVDGLGGPTSIKAEGSLRDVPVDSVRDLWPNGLAQDARDWVIPNLSRGMVREAGIVLSARSPSGRFDDVVVDHLGGELRPEGVTVNYLKPMPVARNAAAVCTFDARTFRIAMKAGEVFGLRLKEGSIVFTGLDQEDQFADIDLVIAGPVSDALRLIDSPPLRYAKALGIEPAKVGGEAVTRLKLSFPLLKSLRLDDVKVKAFASVRQAFIPAVAMGLDLGDGSLALEVDAKGLDASGPIMLGGIPAELSWRENFSAKGVPFRSRYQLRAAELTEDQRRLLGLDGPPFVAPFIAGPVAAEVTATFADNGHGDIDAKVDLATAAMELPGLGWSKPAGQPGRAVVAIDLLRQRITAIPDFSVSAGDLGLAGSVAFRPDGTARRVTFDRLAYGRTSGEGSIAIRPDKGGLDVIFRGASLDARPMLARDKEVARRPARPEDRPPPMTINARARTLWVSDRGSLNLATVNLARDDAEWHTLTLKGSLAGGKSVTATLRPGGPQRRDFTISSDDAGSVMRAFEVYEHMSGGELSIEGHIDDSRPDQPYAGTLAVSDYHIRNAPTLARLLTVAALAGILDLLKGEGVGFSSLEAPFVLSDGLLRITDGRAWGAALGLTAKGQVDLDSSNMAIEGTVVPAYAVNSILGKIPVLGWLVTGGEKGGGIIAFNYTMKGPTTDPSVVVNPLSVLTPGFLRRLFDIFDDGSGTDARKGSGTGE